MTHNTRSLVPLFSGLNHLPGIENPLFSVVRRGEEVSGGNRLVGDFIFAGRFVKTQTTFAIKLMANPPRVSVLAALVLSLSTASALTSRLVINRRPASHCRALAPLLLLDDGAEEEEEATWPRDEAEDLDTAFQRLRLEGLASEWWSDLRLEALEGLPVTTEGHERWWPQRFARDFASASVAVLVFLSVLKLYLLQTGGGLVIVPMGEGGLINVYNFEELKHLEPSHLLKLGIPAATPPPPAAAGAVRPILRFGQLLLLSAHEDVLPPA